MRVLVIENYVGTPPGLVGVALREAGVQVELARCWQGEKVPTAANEYSGLVVLGGEQDALDDAGSPWLPDVVAAIRRIADDDLPVLGICLGAQLVARAAGAENILGRPVEFGWHYVRPTAAGRNDPVLRHLGAGEPLFHWHSDTFTLPEHAERLAESDMTDNQAFRIGRATYGIQFHFEADRALVTEWSRTFAPVIAEFAPDWPERHPLDAARFGGLADETGMAIARAWVGLLR